MLGAKPGERVEYINNDPMDCRRSNLRLVKPKQAAETRQAFGGQCINTSRTGRPLKQLARAVGEAAGEAFGIDGARLIGPTRAAKVRHKYAGVQR